MSSDTRVIPVWEVDRHTQPGVIAVYPMKMYPFLRQLLSPFRLSQQKSLAWCIAAIAAEGEARSRRLAGWLAVTTRVQLGSALNRVYRLLSNARIHDALLTQQLISLLGSDKPLLVAIDWTEWTKERRMLLGSAVVGKRAIPVQAHMIPDHDVWQNREEHRFLRALVQAADRAGKRMILLCDRGFHRVEWLRHLNHTRQGYLVRLCGTLTVHRDGQEPMLLKDVPLKRGQRVDLGRVVLREDKAVTARVIGIWEARRKEPWWLATNLTRSVERIASLYAKRMDIEEQIRDAKGCRFGMKMKWTQHRNPAYLERLMLLIAVALVIWSVIGAAEIQRDRSTALNSNTKGPRISMPEIGRIYLPQYDRRLTWRFVRKHRLPPQLTPPQTTSETFL